jgi:hypothetical protein
MQTRLAVEQIDMTVEVALEGESAIERLRGLKSADRAVEHWLSEAVGEARRAGESWSAIGEALGVTRQAAWKLYNAELLDGLKRSRDQFQLSDEEAIAVAISELKAVRTRRRRR